MSTDVKDIKVLWDLYQKFDEYPELSIASPEYDQIQIDHLIKTGLL